MSIKPMRLALLGPHLPEPALAVVREYAVVLLRDQDGESWQVDQSYAGYVGDGILTTTALNLLHAAVTSVQSGTIQFFADIPAGALFFRGVKAGVGPIYIKLVGRLGQHNATVVHASPTDNTRAGQTYEIAEHTVVTRVPSSANLPEVKIEEGK